MEKINPLLYSLAFAARSIVETAIILRSITAEGGGRKKDFSTLSCQTVSGRSHSFFFSVFTLRIFGSFAKIKVS